MTSETNGTDRGRAVLVLVATLGTIVFNALAATGHINGVTPEMVSGKYPTVVTPAGYAFTIWSLIYVGLLAFSVYQLLPSQLAAFARFGRFISQAAFLTAAGSISGATNRSSSA